MVIRKSTFALQQRFKESILTQNIAANYLSAAYLALLNLFMIPVYLRILGAEQWGIIAVCITLQGCMGLLDSGLGQIMPRDIARTSHDKNELTKTFWLFSGAYGGLALLGFVVGQFFVPYLSNGWLRQSPKVLPELEWTLRLVLLLFLFQFSNNAHLGLFNGIQRQKMANLRQCVFSTLRHITAFLLLTSWKASAYAYLLAFVAMAAIEWICNRYTAIRFLPRNEKPKITLHDYRKLANEVGVIATAILFGMLASQADRIVLSRMVDIIDFGQYVVVANLGLSFLQLQYPLQRAFLPRIASQSNNSSRDFLRLATSIGLLCVIPCLLLIFIAHWLLKTWTGNVQLADVGALPFRLILASVAINSCYAVIYQKFLTQQRGGSIFLINLAMLLLAYPLLFIMTPYWGTTAGGITWLCTTLLQLTLGIVFYLRNKTRAAL